MLNMESDIDVEEQARSSVEAYGKAVEGIIVGKCLDVYMAPNVLPSLQTFLLPTAYNLSSYFCEEEPF